MNSTFPQFSDLASELRIQIWQEAFRSAAANRMIPVTINHHPAITPHYCLPLLKPFCGQHSHCPSIDLDPDQPSSSLVSMFNGYFSLSANTSVTQLEEDALLNISLVCTESRSVYLSEFPDTITIYKDAWYPRTDIHPQRQVRCNPATDTLLVKDVPSFYSGQRHPSSSRSHPEDLFHEAIREWYPQNPDVFANLRYIISRFQHVEFPFLPDTFSDGPTPRPMLFSRVFEDVQFQRFLVFFESLEHLYLCSKTEGLTFIRNWKRVQDIKDSRDGSMDNMDDNFVGVSSSVLNCDDGYEEFLQIQSELSPDGAECCWVPTPKGFGGKWLFCSRDVLDED